MRNLYIFGVKASDKKQMIIGFDSVEKKFFEKKVPH